MLNQIYVGISSDSIPSDKCPHIRKNGRWFQLIWQEYYPKKRLNMKKIWNHHPSPPIILLRLCWSIFPESPCVCWTMLDSWCPSTKKTNNKVEHHEALEHAKNNKKGGRKPKMMLISRSRPAISAPTCTYAHNMHHFAGSPEGRCWTSSSASRCDWGWWSPWPRADDEPRTTTNRMGHIAT